MPGQSQSNRIELITLLTQASHRMHASVDIAKILHVAVETAISLTETKLAAAGLMIDGQMAFSEFMGKQGWVPMPCRFGADSWFAPVFEQQQSVEILKKDIPVKFDCALASALGEEDAIIVVPVLGLNSTVLGCLMMQKKGAVAEELKQLSVMVASAIENSIQSTERERIEADLEKSVATYRTLVEQIPAVTYIATLDRKQMLFVSPQVHEILGYSQEDFLANQEIWMQQIHPDDLERVQAAVRQSVEGEVPFHAEYRVRTKKGSYLWIKDAADVVRESGAQLYLQGVLYDIHERKEYEKEMVRLAHFDQLTGLANRALFLDRLSQAIVQSKRQKLSFAVLFLDLDGFKAINDNLGHLVGDQLLKDVAQRLTSQLREADTVARMGGDEFTLILKDISRKEDIVHVAEKLVQAVAAPYPYIDEALQVTTSIGISCYPEHSTDADHLMTLADNAMYESKRNGKNRFSFSKHQELV